MKIAKITITTLTPIILALTAILISNGCSVSPDQAAAVADQAGMYSAVGWIALDNPSPETIAAAKLAMVAAKQKIAEVKGGKTYLEVVYPEVAKIIDSQISEPQYRPLAKAGAASILGGLDLLFITKPEWKEDEKVALTIATAYIDGAVRGLGLDNDSPIITQARTVSALRTTLQQQ